MPLHFTYIIRSQLCFLFCCILRLADLPQLFQSTHSRKYISCFRFITSTCLQKIISPDQLNSEVLVTPPFCFYWICLTMDCKDIYIPTTSLNDRIFKAINLSSVQNKALITFIDVGQKVPLWLFFFWGMLILHTSKTILLHICIFQVQIKEILSFLANHPPRQAHSKLVAAAEGNILLKWVRKRHLEQKEGEPHH